jgi:hypothetical protein
MNSYQKRKLEIASLKARIELLEKEISNKGNVFFAENKWLGINKMIYGVVVDGQIVQTHEVIK